MSNFVSKKLKKVELPEGEFVEIPMDVSFEDAQIANTIRKDCPDEFEQTLKLLMRFIKSWNLKDEDGNDAELSEENLKQLKMSALTKIQKEIMIVMGLDEDGDKKKAEKESVG